MAEEQKKQGGGFLGGAKGFASGVTETVGGAVGGYVKSPPLPSFLTFKRIAFSNEFLPSRATNTVGDTVGTLGKGVGDTVGGVTKGVGDTTKKGGQLVTDQTGDGKKESAENPLGL
ncbi:hypothetical protein MMC14_004888 [Varicellaria rhodocarpa]|nr:hypothetical protein [Varicellaria rhodocarpa]